MDDLKLIRTLLAHEPPPELADRTRSRLRNGMRGPARRRKAGRVAPGWAAAGLGLTAAAAAAALVISNVVGPTVTPDGPPAAAPTARQVLLAAAATAETVPEGTGTYWHVTMLHDPPLRGRHQTEVWFRRDGQAWASVTPDSVRKLTRRQVITFSFTGMTSGQLQSLPTEPAALRRWILNALRAQYRKGEPNLEIPSNTLEVELVHVLHELLYYLPVQQKVRAAAFRVLAVVPGVKRVGAVKEGQVLEYLDGPNGGQVGIRMVIDPKTTSGSIGNFSIFGGRIKPDGTNTFKAEWTDERPGKVLPPQRGW